VSAVFITGTGTDVGKTFVAAGLIRYFRGLGQPVAALKPLVSGFDPAAPSGSDPAILLDALGREVKPEEFQRIAPWRFRAPLSPDMAARAENKAIDLQAVVAFCRAAIAGNAGTLLIEGIGGIMVPLDGRHTVLDLMSLLNLPLILVAGSYLGTLSHVLSAPLSSARPRLPRCRSTRHWRRSPISPKPLCLACGGKFRRGKTTRSFRIWQS
jgi:dethiobiotin synthetase